MKLRYYQEDCIKEILKMNKGEKKIVEACTGAGKTIIMSELCRLTDKRVLIVVMSSELKEQTVEKLKMVCGENVDVGCVQGIQDEVSNRIIVATRQSLTSSKSTRIERMLQYGEFEYILLDECHMAVQQQKKIIENVSTKNTKCIGFSATPYNKDLKKIYSDFIYRKDLFSMIKEKFLVPPRCFIVESNTDISKVKTTGGEYVISDLDRVVNNTDRNNLIVNAYKEKCTDRKQTIVFATSIEHSNDLANEFKNNGIKAMSIDSTLDKKEREKVFNKFKNGEINVITNVGICTTGLDIPSIDSLILARPTKSKSLFVQMVGRSLRLSPETYKEDALIIDIADNTNRHSLINCKTIFDIENGETPIEAEQRRNKEEKEKIERKKKEEELRLQQEEEIRLQEIELFNETVNNILNNSTLDWFTTRINGTLVACLSSTINNTYVIRKEENIFKCYLYKQKPYFDYDFELLEENDNLQELQETIENIALEEGSNFISKSASWKYEKATQKQIDASKGKLHLGDLKGYANKFFCSRALYFAFKKYDKNNKINC